MDIQKVYRSLKIEGVCRNATDFSVRFLGMAPNYYSVLKTRANAPSLKALLYLEHQLKQCTDSEALRECLVQIRLSKEEVLLER